MGIKYHDRSIKQGVKNKMATPRKKSNPAFMKDLDLSPELADIVGKPRLPRTQVTKKVWEYIKKHRLQDPVNRRYIIPDKKLAKVIGSKSIDMFLMTKKISKHLS